MALKFTRSLLGALALSTALIAASPSFAAGKLTVSLSQDPGSWDPVDTFLVAWATVATNIFDGLTYRGPDLKLVPGLAESWQVSDDGKKITFKLRQNVKFHDGEPFNADAVKFTFDRLLVISYGGLASVAVRTSCCHLRKATSDWSLSRLWPPFSEMYGAGSTNWPSTMVEKCRCGPVERPVEPT